MAEDTPPPHTPEPPVRDASLKTPEALVWGGFLGIAAVGLVTLAASGAEIWTRDYWGGNRSEILRNIGLLVLAVPALWLAWRRTNTASRQADIANENKETANRQQRVAERGMNVERYQKGAQMLESDELSVRIAGIYGLRELAINDPDESYIIVRSLLFAFIREKSRERALKQPEADDEPAGAADTTRPTYEDLGPDVYEALDATTALRAVIPNATRLEEDAQWRPQMQRANLSNESLFQANLLGADLVEADLLEADLAFVKLSDANLNYANLSGTNLQYANLSGAEFFAAKLDERTKLTGIWAWADRPPKNMPPEIEAAITYRDPAEREVDD